MIEMRAGELEEKNWEKPYEENRQFNLEVADLDGQPRPGSNRICSHGRICGRFRGRHYAGRGN
jgi:hypothetical protein